MHYSHESDPDQKKPRSKVSALVYHPDYMRLRRHILWVVVALALFAVFNVYLVLTKGEPLLINMLLGTLTAYVVIFLVMVILIVVMWNDGVLLLLVVPLFTLLLGIVIGECRRHTASLLFGLLLGAPQNE